MREQCRRFWIDYIITMYSTHVGLKANTWSLEWARKVVAWAMVV